MMYKKINLLINLPVGFFIAPALAPVFDYLLKIANVRKTSHNTQEQIQEDLSWAEAIIMWSWPSFTDEMLDKALNLKFVGHINGTQASINACFNKGIAVSEARHAWSPAVAELALGLILNGLRKISQYHIDMRNGKENWVMDFPGDIDVQERQLTGRTVGIVGFGKIGQLLTELMTPFKTEIKVFDPYLPEDVIKKYNVSKVLSVLELIETSEIVILCAANNKGSEKVVGIKEIDAFRSNSILVNVGRSSLIDMEALQNRLEKNDMIAMLDVFDMEPLEVDSLLRSLKNVYLTPHRAGGVMDSVIRSLYAITYDIEAFCECRERKCQLTKAMLTSLPE
jgi:phosphoglycerate dehydrogenase-like enzyme